MTKEELIKVTEHVDVNTEGRRKLQISKRIREKIDGDIEKAANKIAYLQKLNQVMGVELPLETQENDLRITIQMRTYKNKLKLTNN